MNSNSEKPKRRWLPLVIGALLVAQFAGLGVWQISRGLEKRATQHAYRGETHFQTWQAGQEVRSFQRLQVSGSYDIERQIILDNIIFNSRYGHYVITPLQVAADQPLLLINRGWAESAPSGPSVDERAGAISEGEIIVRGRAGSLPKAGYKMGDAFAAGQNWPKHAVYPSLEDVAAELGQAVQPFVLLMDHEEEHGFVRHWVPSEFGPGKHFGYALQWFAMAAVLSGLLAWNYRKRRFDA